jgi:biotin carboxyl carrier protein
MTVEVAIGDRVRTVSVVRKGAVLHVALDGHLHIVDVRRIDESSLSMLVQSGAEAMPVRSIDASFAVQAPGRRLVRRSLGEGGNLGEGGGDFDVHISGRTVPVQVRPSTWMTRQGASSAPRAGLAGAGPQRVVSPMPGKIVRVLVKAGDQVIARQGLVVVEAMKMENELRAARNGRVRELSVAEGQSVDAGTVLLVVE